MSEDPFLKEFANLLGAQFVFTSSSLAAMMNNHSSSGFIEAWDIPVKISRDSKLKTRIVYFHDPMPLRKPNLRNVLTDFYTKVLRSNFVNKTVSHSFPLEENVILESDSVEDTLNPEVFAQTEKCKSKMEFVNLLSKAEENFIYTQWTIGSNNIPVLLRSNIECFVDDDLSSIEQLGCKNRRMVNLKAKIEFQPNSHIHNLSYEEFRLSESVQNWIDCYLRGDTHICIGHVQASNQELCFLEKKNLKDLMDLHPGYK